ncbi:MAG TPA: DUF1116 domain-containing protein [Candidatus Korarchaeota archaeon]|nr:DUF1116 domain-containing protein [Candidatus Korarchaeota archaeon]
MDDIERANEKAVERILDAKPVLVDIELARKAIPGMKDDMMLHAGPPITWERMCGPMKGAVMGALIYEGLVDSPEQASKLAESGDIEFSPCHHHRTVGPMAGVVSPSMPVFVVRNESMGNEAYCTINEGLGKVLRFGAYDEGVIARLKWMEEILFPVLRDAVRDSGGIDLKAMISRALHMGDECHNRNIAGSSLFLNKISPYIVKTGYDKEIIARVIDFIAGNGHFFLNLSMPACKSMMDAAHNIKNCTIVTAMSRNGVEFGIRVSGLGDRWFKAPAPLPKGLYFPGFSERDANPDLGDSSITETAGLGGFSMAAAPAIAQFVGGSPSDAIKYTKEMWEITLTRNKSFTIPILNFEGSPTGIDLRKVIETGIQPLINTGIAHKDPEIGQVGAGIVRAPMDCFKKALMAFVEEFQA